MGSAAAEVGVAEGYEAAKDDEPDVEAHAFEGPRGFEGYEKPADK